MSYLEFVIPEHVLWIHLVQLSQRMQVDLVVTALLHMHTPQGRTGPGLDDT